LGGKYVKAISIREDAAARAWRARTVATEARRRWLWIAVGGAAFASSLAVRDSKLLSLALLILSAPGAAIVAMVLVYPFIRWMPQRWNVTDKRISGIGAMETGASRWSDLTSWSIGPIDDLPGYMFVGWSTARRRSNGIVLSPASPRHDIEQIFRERAAGKEQSWIKSVA
jgi:hypothetical protein